MRFPWTDKIATLLVATAVVAYAAWLGLADRPGETSIRLMVGVVLVLGFAASATAVVPAFDELLRSSKVYLVVASLIGLAFVVGVAALVDADKTMLAVVVAATAVLWAMATVRHVRLTAATPGGPVVEHKNRQRVLADRPR